MKVLNRHQMQRPWPKTAVYVGRGHPLGNQFVIGRDGDRDAVIEKYRRWLWEQIKAENSVVVDALKALSEDSQLVCSCAPKRCHAEIIRDAWNWMKAGGVK